MEAADETITLNLGEHGLGFMELSRSLCSRTLIADYLSTKQALQQLNFDVLIFADTLSEPMTHFLSKARFAPIQAAFWGNPVTTGSPNIDYFISADRMEDPFRTKMARDTYEEQVVLLDGQGIWYTEFEELRNKYFGDEGPSKEGGSMMTLEDFGLPTSALPRDAHIYLCAQSLFKLSSAFDDVVGRLLTADPSGVVIFTSGRRDKWTQTFRERLSLNLSAEILSRIHLIPRVDSLSFPTLVSLSDVMLHPFPFGGSRTSLDGLAANIPVVTFPQRYLRGRMAVSFYAQMGLWEPCVAWSIEEYVEKAARLGKDREYRDNVKEMIADRLPRVYNDMKVVEEWTRWLGRIAGIGDVGEQIWGEAGKEVWQGDEEINKVFTRMQAMQKEGMDRGESGGEAK